MNYLKVLLSLILFSSIHFLQAQKKTINLGVVTDCPTSSVGLAELIVKEAKILLKSDFNLILKPENTLQSDCDVDKIKQNINSLLSNSKVDIILGLDVLSSHVIAHGGPYSKPVIGVTILNAQVQKCPITIQGTSGVKNMAYLELPFSPVRDLEVFYKTIGFTKLTLLMDETFVKGIPEMVDFIKSKMTELGISYNIVTIENTPEATIAKISQDTDAVYLFPSNNLTDTQYQGLISQINDRKLLSFSVLGRLAVDLGVLAGVAPTSNIDLIARRIALDIQRISNGESAEDMNVRLPHKEQLVMNMATARQIDFSPSWEALAEAVLINETAEDVGRNVNLYDAIKDGLEHNLDIKVAAYDVSISEKNVDIAKASLLPEVKASASHTIVDKDLANISNGQNPQNKGAAALQVSQVIYSEQVTANKQIQDILVKASEAALEIQSLDVVLDVSSAYLNLMQAKTAENINRQNLDVTRKNLELSRVSSSLGQSGPSDVYRWQGEIANAKSALLNATASRKQAEMALNQLTNRPISEVFTTQEVNIEDTHLMINNDAIGKYINNPRDFYRYADFMVEKAKSEAPDLSQFDYNLEAQKRSVLLNKRNRYVPTVTLGGGYNYELYRNGEGSEIPTGFPTPNDWNWNLQLGASLPIFQGGSREASVQQSKIQLSQLNMQKLNTERLIEQQVRSQLENVRASFRNIDLTDDAEEAAVKNFEIVQDSYSKGAVTITQLLDAQNAAISAQLNSANAVYFLLIDVLSFERATGSYYMLLNESEKATYTNEIIDYFNR